MTPALELDDAMIRFSKELASKGLPTFIGSQADIDLILSGFQDYLQELNLWQYYVLDIKKERESVLTALTGANVAAWDGPDVAHKSLVELTEVIRASGKINGYKKLEKKFGTYVDGSVAAGLVKAAFVDLGIDVVALADAWVRVVDVLNVPLYEEWKEDTRVALDNIKNRLRYTRLDDHGPKLGPITEQ